MLEMPQALINAMQARTASTNGKPSLQWPGTTFGVRWRSNSLDTTSRSACAAVSDENTPPFPHRAGWEVGARVHALLARRRRHARVQERQHVERRERALEGLRWPARPGS
jgi:hypothetical protein